MPTWIKTYRLILWLILAIFVLYFAYLALVPSGQVSYRYDFSQPSQFIGPLTPGDRVREPANGEQALIGNPVYFSLATPRPFDHARLTIRYRNPDQLANLEAGVLVDKKLWRYQLQPLANQLIDQAIASGAWGLLRNDSTILLQRSERYNSIADFLAQPPAKSAVALYNHQLPASYLPPATTTQALWTHALKGDYQFYGYHRGGQLTVDFRLTDLNDDVASDPVEVLIYDQANQLVARQELADDGVSARPTSNRRLGIRQALPSGLYKLEFKAGSDIITDQLTSNLAQLAFINRLWLAPTSSKLEFFASGGQLTFQTINPASLGPITINQELLDFNQGYRQLNSVNDCGQTCRIKLPAGDIIVSLDGVLAVDPSQLLDPRWLNLANRRSIPANVKYILANYSAPKLVGNDQEAILDLDLSQAYREKGKYSFLLSAPSLSAEDAINDSLTITDIQIELSGDTWRDLLAKLFQS